MDVKDATVRIKYEETLLVMIREMVKGFYPTRRNVHQNFQEGIYLKVILCYIESGALSLF